MCKLKGMVESPPENRRRFRESRFLCETEYGSAFSASNDKKLSSLFKIFTA